MTDKVQNSQVSESKEYVRRLTAFFSDTEPGDLLETTLMCYRGNDKNPEWTDVEPGMFEILGNFQTLPDMFCSDRFTTICTLTADVSRVRKQIIPNAIGGKYHSVTFDVVIKFGLTELQAQLRWREEVNFRRFLDSRSKSYFLSVLGSGTLVCPFYVFFFPFLEFKV